MAQESDLNSSRRTHYLWIELAVVLAACLAPWMFTSVADVYGLRGVSSVIPFEYHALNFIVSYTGIIAVILFIIWRSNDPLRRFGVAPFQIGRDLVGGIAIGVILRVVSRLLYWG